MKILYSFLFFWITVIGYCKSSSNPLYSFPKSPWPESFGNHRAVLEISMESGVVILDLVLRRHDPRPDNKQFIIVEAATGDTVPNIYRYSVTNERCRFGLMGDMLQGGGNRWMGMVYGMTVRHPWTTEGVLCDPRPVWKIWDEFGIESSVMKGYWEKDCPVTTNIKDILATVYQIASESLISVASWADSPVKFSFQIDWKTLGLDPAKAILFAPAIKDFQEESIFKPGDSISIEPKKGWLIYLRGKE